MKWEKNKFWLESQQQEFAIETLSDFFKLLDSFWIACKILIPYWMLQKLQNRITTAIRWTDVAERSTSKREAGRKLGNLSLDKSTLESGSASRFCIKWWLKAHPTTFSAPAIEEKVALGNELC